MNIIETYYEKFNAQDVEGMVALLSDDVTHEVSQGQARHGVEAFRAFLHHMNRCYRETVRELCVMSLGGRAAAEFWLDGEYLQTDGALPEAKGQRYALRVGAFFEVREGLISRVSNHYNMQEWLSQVR